MPASGSSPRCRITNGTDAASRTMLQIVRVNDTTLAAHVFRGNREITDECPSGAFVWARESGDTAADTIWNASRSGCKQITLESTDADNDAQIICTYTETAGSYGSVQVYADNNALVADYDTGISDAGDVFTIEDGMLKVTTASAHGTDYSLKNGTLTVNEGFSGTLTSTVTFNGTPQTKEIDFEYDHNGMRTKKTVTENGRTEITEYTLHGKLITHMTKRSAGADGSESTQVLHFFYDAQSRPAVVEYSGDKYRYVHNLQGDIIGIIDQQGDVAAEYKYDAWGGDIDHTVADDIWELNPFRYRGYAYDENSGRYNLGNRIYAAKISRFISADVCTGSVGQITSHALYSYCRNTPIMMCDDDGYDPKLFYYYGDDQKNHAQSNIEDLQSVFDIKEYYITCPQDFTDAWTDMYSVVGNENIDVVVINLHGDPYSVENIDPQQLDYSKQIDTFVLLSCNGGHQNTGFTNIAQAFLHYSNRNIRQLIAADGTHYRGTVLHPFRGIKVKGDKYWKKYNNGKGYKSLGFVNYTRDKNGGYNVSSIGKAFKSVLALLRKVGW